MPSNRGIESEPLLRVEAVAKLLDVAPRTVYIRAQRGEIPGAVRIGRALRFNPRAIRLFVERGGDGTR